VAERCGSARAGAPVSHRRSQAWASSAGLSRPTPDPPAECDPLLGGVERGEASSASVVRSRRPRRWDELSSAERAILTAAGSPQFMGRMRRLPRARGGRGFRRW
jgi:hypothetical protein